MAPGRDHPDESETSSRWVVLAHRVRPTTRPGRHASWPGRPADRSTGGGRLVLTVGQSGTDSTPAARAAVAARVRTDPGQVTRLPTPEWIVSGARYPRMVSATSPSSTDGRRVALLTLGCARNEVDSEELAARLHADGWQVTTDGEGADVVLVNTCGFVEKAKQDSIQTLLAAADTGAKVVAAGCMAERYGRELADSLPEAQAVLGFDDYPDISARLNSVLAGERVDAHTPRDRRELLPLTPVARRDSAVVVPGHGGGAQPVRADLVTDEHTPAHLRSVLRRRLDTGPVASLKLASGCDRRCAFCAIPAFRGAFVSRTPDELLAEAEWLAASGVRELVLVSENSTSYGKDLGDPRAAGETATAARRDFRDRPGPGQLPAAGGDPARPDRGDRHHTGGRALLRSLLPALGRAGAAPDASIRIDEPLPRTAGHRPRAGAGGRRAEQLHRRVPRRDPRRC